MHMWHAHHLYAKLWLCTPWTIPYIVYMAHEYSIENKRISKQSKRIGIDLAVTQELFSILIVQIGNTLNPLAPKVSLLCVV